LDVRKSALHVESATKHPFGSRVHDDCGRGGYLTHGYLPTLVPSLMESAVNLDIEEGCCSHRDGYVF
jgi:hypothetical protein